MAVLLPLLLLIGCSKTSTVTVTQPAVTITQPAVTVTQPPVTVTQPAVTVTSPPTTVTQPPVTVTATPTWIPNPFRGTMVITWEGKTPSGYPVSGTASMTTDENGDISGTFSSSYSGNVTGLVDLMGNMIAVGILQGDTAPIASTWTSKITLSGKTLSCEGEWKSSEESGTFTGTGTVSY
jgi:hypothetical protein